MLEQQSKPEFEDLGFFREYYIEGKFIGTVPCKKDRELIGYHGRITETLKEDVTVHNGKKIKKGTEVSTYLYPLCGRVKK